MPVDVFQFKSDSEKPFSCIRIKVIVIIIITIKIITIMIIIIVIIIKWKLVIGNYFNSLAILED